MISSATLILALGLALPLLGAGAVAWARLPMVAARLTLAILVALAFVSLLAPFVPTPRIPAAPSLLALDDLARPLLPTLALLHLLTLLGTAKSRVTTGFCVRVLLSAFLGIAIVACQRPSLLVLLLAASTLLPYWELRVLGRAGRGFLLHMTLFVGLLALGWSLLSGPWNRAGHLAILGALLLRAGVLPLHGWIPRLFQSASFGTAALYVLPLVEIPVALRLLLPGATPDLLAVAGAACLVTAVYAGGMAIVQDEIPRFFAYLCLSQTSLVLFGVCLLSVNGLTAALCLWVSTSLSLACLAFTLRTLEARFGRLLLSRFHGHYEQVPGLAVAFLVTGLACVGFPGTLGFIPLELLLSGSADQGLHVSFLLALAAMLNGVALLRAYFSLFTGRRPSTSFALPVTRLERTGIVLIALLIFLGAWLPPGVVASRHQVAERLLASRPAPVPPPASPAPSTPSARP